MRNFGIECEVGGGTSDVLSHLGIDRLHSYHCGCSQCDPRREAPDWTAQQDCTSDGEFISRILTYGTGEATSAIDALGAALVAARAWHSDGSDGGQVQGLHVHVAGEGVLGEHAPMVHLWRLWFAHAAELEDIAGASYGAVREYNPDVSLDMVTNNPDAFWNTENVEHLPRCGTPYGRGWVNLTTGHGTIEFRLWNATRTAWRMHLCAGISVALVQAAADGVNAHPDDDVSLFERLAPYFTPATTAAYVRHLYGKEMQ